MKEYIGLDVSLKETAVSIRCDGKRVWRGKCASDPKVIAELVRKLVADARQSEACQILMSIPGVGTITATAFIAAIEDPDNFRKSRSVAAWLGHTPRRYQSGEVDCDGHISRRGDNIGLVTVWFRSLEIIYLTQGD